MRLCVLLPALNEEATLAQVIDGIPRDIEGIDEVRIIVIDDGSTDKTGAIARQKGSIVVRHQAPQGVGAAFHSGIVRALEEGPDLVVNIDADGQFNPQDIPFLLAPLMRDEADFATCSRFKDPALIPKMPWIKKWGNARVAQMVSMLIRTKFHDVACGFRAYNREAILNMNLFGKFTYTQETFIDLALKGLRIVEVPLSVRGEREYGKSRVASSILKYAIRTSRILGAAYKDYRPGAFYTVLSFLFGLPGFLLGGFFLGHYWQTGKFSPHLWAGFSSGFMVTVGFVLLLVAVVSDSLQRLRYTSEKILYYQKRAMYDSLCDGPKRKDPKGSS